MGSSEQESRDGRFRERRLRMLLESLPLSIAAIDEDEIYRHVNSHYASLVDRPADQLIGSHVRDVLSPEAYTLAKPFIDEVLDGKPGSYEGQFQFREDAPCWLSIHLVPDRDEEGRSSGFVVMSTDITKRKEAEATRVKLEEQLRQSRKMEAIGTLAGGVAHDFNNILQTVMGYTEMLAARLDGDEDARRDLEEIEKGCERASMLTRQLLTFSRRQVIQPQHLDPGEVVSGVLKMLRRLIGEDIELVFESAGDLATVFADRNQLEQVLMNLAINARDAMPDGGSLTVTLENRRLDSISCHEYEELLPGRFVVLTVEDTGRGMDEKIMSRAFEPFFTTKKPGRGTGLGLATVYGIVRQHDGQVFVHSRQGQGSRFEIFLPAATAVVEHQESKTAEAPPGGSETILLAEDDENVSRIVAGALGAAGYRVLAVRDGRTAVEAFAARPGEIDLVIIDAVMPLLNGKQALEKIRRLSPAMRAMFITGYPVERMHERFDLDGEIQLLQKPFSPDDLLRRVRGLLDGG